MRKCEFESYIIKKGQMQMNKPEEWTKKGRYKTEILRGVFHGWGTGYDELKDGPVQTTTAIVELPNGKIKTPKADCVRLLQENK